VDLCFVPATHEAQEELPAVSGSSGRLVVGRSQAHRGEPHWPGQVLAQADLDYALAMRQYAEATRDRLLHGKRERALTVREPSPWQQTVQGQVERYRVRQRRRGEDAAWKAAKAERRRARQAYQTLPRAERRQQQAAWQVAEETWRQLRGQRQQTLVARQGENEAWHQRNGQRRASRREALERRSWLALLVVTDNCTRQCLGLPLFRAGPKLTSEELVRAFRALLPQELEFVISDQGVHFRTNAFAQLVEEYGFIHVPVYRHRPESNGIAERLVLTLKAWLEDKSWQAAEDLQALLAAFQPEYNDRPHQGLGIPGLSPNEFANRIWLM